MAKTVSPSTIAALEALALLDRASASQKSFSMKITQGDLKNIRAYLRIKAQDRHWLKRLTTTIDGGILYIVLREPNRIELLEGLLEEALLHVDEDGLYSRIMEVLYGNG